MGSRTRRRRGVQRGIVRPAPHDRARHDRGALSTENEMLKHLIALSALAVTAVAQVQVSIAVRETGFAGGTFTAIGANGGSTGGIEWINRDGQTLTLDGTWQTFSFNLATDPKLAFAGTSANSILEGAFGVLEHVRVLNPTGITAPLAIWIDDVANTITPPAMSPVTTTFGTFEGYANGTEVMFQEPSNSGSTAANLAVGSTSRVDVTTTPSASYRMSFQFIDNLATRWVRLTTFNVTNQGNPQIRFDQDSVVTFRMRGIVCQNAASYALAAGAGCPRSGLIYQQFPMNGTPLGSFDLNGTCLTFTRNLQGSYQLDPAGSFNPAFANRLDSSDDQAFVDLPLGFSFPNADGSTTTMVSATSNGYVITAAGYFGDPLCCTGNLTTFRDQLWPTFAVCGEDLVPDNGPFGDPIDVYYDAFPNMAMFTWNMVPFFPGNGAVTCQVQLHSDGRVVMCWNGFNATNEMGTVLVGFSPGNGVADTGAIDLSAGHYDVGYPGLPLTQGAFMNDVPVIGQSFDLELSNIPAATASVAMLAGLSPASLQLDPIGMHTCVLQTRIDLIRGITPAPPVQVVTTAIPNDCGLLGLTMFTQFAAIDTNVGTLSPSPGFNVFGINLSNAGRLVFGTQ
jgi:hypothetical protein